MLRAILDILSVCRPEVDTAVSAAYAAAYRIRVALGVEKAVAVMEMMRIPGGIPGGKAGPAKFPVDKGKGKEKEKEIEKGKEKEKEKGKEKEKKAEIEVKNEVKKTKDKITEEEKEFDTIEEINANKERNKNLTALYLVLEKEVSAAAVAFEHLRHSILGLTASLSVVSGSDTYCIAYLFDHNNFKCAIGKIENSTSIYRSSL